MRKWPAINTPSSSASTGIVQPHLAIEAMILARSASVWIRALLA